MGPAWPDSPLPESALKARLEMDDVSFVSDDARGDGRRADHEIRGQSVSPRLAGATGGGLFIAGSILAVLLAFALPHPDGVNAGGFMWLALAELVYGCTLLAWSRLGGRSRRWLGPTTIAGAVAAVTVSVHLCGEGDQGPALMAEFFYVWPALYAGYFFSGRAVVGVVAAVGLAYLGVNTFIDVESSAVAIRTIIVLSVVGGTAGVAYALRRHVDALLLRLDGLARTDILTALVNRRGFDETLEDELDRYRRSGDTLALVLGDLDRFKTINDRFGHSAGDEVLRQVGRLVIDSVRSVDTAARIGGEEFAVLMPSTSGAEAVAAADRLRRAVASVKDPSGQPVEITFGVASTDDLGCGDSDALLSAADQALYSAKAQGRNRTAAFAGPPRSPAPIG